MIAKWTLHVPSAVKFWNVMLMLQLLVPPMQPRQNTSIARLFVMVSRPNVLVSSVPWAKVCKCTLPLERRVRSWAVSNAKPVLAVAMALHFPTGPRTNTTYVHPPNPLLAVLNVTAGNSAAANTEVTSSVVRVK
jgi:hypothetical protein